jgi:hypothetical protein
VFGVQPGVDLQVTLLKRGQVGQPFVDKLVYPGVQVIQLPAQLFVFLC